MAAAGALALAALDRRHHPVVLHVRLRQPPERAKLRAAERLHARPRRQRHLGQIGVVRAGIDRAVKRLVDLVEALRIADADQRAHLLVHQLERAALGAGHALGGKARAQRLELRHRLEHAGQPLLARPRHHRRAMGARLDQARGGELPDRLAHRRARHTKTPRQLHLVERSARHKRAAHDLVGKLKPQLLRERAAAVAKRDAHRRDLRR